MIKYLNNNYCRQQKCSLNKMEDECKERHNVQLCKALTSVSPVIYLSSNMHFKCKQKYPRLNSYLNSKR